jgi:hypothetical protein
MTGFHGSLAARFMAKVEVPYDDPYQCWIWKGYIQSGGHGQMNDGLAHRIAYEVLVGPIPDGMTIDHECHNLAVSRGECEGGPSCLHRRCVNPWHLQAKSGLDNQRGGVKDWTTKPTCKNGHSSTQRKRSPSGQTYCRECRAEYKAKALDVVKLKQPK